MKKKRIVLLLALISSLTIFTGCGKDSKDTASTSFDSQEANAEGFESDVPTLEYCVQGYYTEMDCHSDGSSSTYNLDVTFYGYLQNPDQLDDGSFSGIIANDCFSTAEPVLVASTGSILTDSEDIEVVPAYPFDEDYIRDLIYQKQPTVLYSAKANTDGNPNIHYNDLTISKDTISDIRFATLDDNKDREDSLLFYSNCSWKGTLYLTTTEGTVFTGTCFFEYEPLRHDEEDYQPNLDALWSYDLDDSFDPQ